MATDRVLKALNYLHRILEAGERGYSVSASNVNNQGLKILLKSYAQQRSRFKSEIESEIKRLGGAVAPRSSFLGVLHRGRIDIFAALTIGNKEREGVVLKEILIGEKVALRTYQVLLKRDFPNEIRAMLEKQYTEISNVVEQIQLMRGVKGKQLSVQLFDADSDVEIAIYELKKAGVDLETIQKVVIADSIELYTGKGTTVFETSISGSVGGALWGGLIGFIAGFSAQSASAVVSDSSMVMNFWALIAIAGLLAGGLIGLVFGYFIGLGISEDDSYLYNQSVLHGKIIMLALAKSPDGKKTSQILTQLYHEKRLIATGSAD